MKYQASGGPGPPQIAEVLRAHVSGVSAETEVWRFASALAFNWLIGGMDAHAKNYALLLDHADIRLAPLYDVSSYLPYDDSSGRKIKLAMTVGRDYRLGATDRRSAWVRAARTLGLDPQRLIELVANMARATPLAFETAAQLPDLAHTRSDLPERLVELVTTRCEACVAILQ